MEHSDDTLRAYDRWHWILTLALLALLVVLPWGFGMGPNSWRSCPALEAGAGAVATTAPGVEQPASQPAAGAEAVSSAATPAPAAPTPATPAPITGESSGLTDAAAPAANMPSAVVYFALDRDKLPANSDQALADVIKHLRTHSDAKAQLVGFHDPTGSPRHNVALARSRALTVRGALEDSGIARRRLVIRKPANTTGSGSNEEARRVEVTIVQ